MTGSGRSYPGLARFQPRLEVLPPAQRALWPRLTALPEDAVLYGGTALALRLGHRASVDFDLFLPRHFEPGAMRRELDALGAMEVVQSAPDALGVRVDGVWISLFGVDLATAAPPVVTLDIGLPVGSLLDVGATKLQTIVDRAESRDYVDIDAVLTSGVDLGDLLGAAQIIFGARFAPMLALKALTSFEDGDLTSLPIAQRQRLMSAAAGVSRIPVMGAYRSSVSPQGTAGEDA
ncbi:MAG: nucleotidyl transferase AbiEii/AbiGii toxin family protein [Candidatus Limnocylindrales bacterium]